MSDRTVAALLRSPSRLVVVEAPAGCGKTWQGANYARDVAPQLGRGRLLILTHTHAACSVFAERTRGIGAKVEIRTIDALVTQIANAYRLTLQLPDNLSSWAWQNGGQGFEIMACRVAALLKAQPMIAQALAARYPLVILDEHQDTTNDQHEIVMALFEGGAAVRVFGDPWQRIFGDHADKAYVRDWKRWDDFKAQGRFDKLDHPHRWDKGCPELGRWVMDARERLEAGEVIDLGGWRPRSVRILMANNIGEGAKNYRLSKDEAGPIRSLVKKSDQMMILANNSLVRQLAAFWYRQVPIWEGHTREALASLADAVHAAEDRPENLADAFFAFANNVSVGFTESAHGALLRREVTEGCRRSSAGKPGNLRQIALRLIDDPNHRGVSAALALFADFTRRRVAGFENVCIDHRAELRDAIRLGEFGSAHEGFAEVARRRAHAQLSPQAKVLCSIHKAKGLECEDGLVMACDRTRFSGTTYSRCKLYVALSRAKRSLTLVVSDRDPSPLFKLG